MDDVSYMGVAGYLKVNNEYNLYFVSGFTATIIFKQLITDHSGKPIAIVSNSDAIYNWDNISHIYKSKAAVPR